MIYESSSFQSMKPNHAKTLLKHLQSTLSMRCSHRCFPLENSFVSGLCLLSLAFTSWFVKYSLRTEAVSTSAWDCNADSQEVHPSRNKLRSIPVQLGSQQEYLCTMAGHGQSPIFWHYGLVPTQTDSTCIYHLQHPLVCHWLGG